MDKFLEAYDKEKIKKRISKLAYKPKREISNYKYEEIEE